MKRFLALLTAVLALASSEVHAIVPRPAANVEWIDASGTNKSFAEFKGQPIVLIIAPSPRSFRFRIQIGKLNHMYERYAAQKVVFVAAFTETQGRVKSNIPFAIATNGPKVGFDYQANDSFTIAIIGRDGNLDYVTQKVLPAQRIFDVIGNSFVPQEAMRRP
jgi:hypothetical protein